MPKQNETNTGINSRLCDFLNDCLSQSNNCYKTDDIVSLSKIHTPTQIEKNCSIVPNESCANYTTFRENISDKNPPLSSTTVNVPSNNNSITYIINNNSSAIIVTPNKNSNLSVESYETESETGATYACSLQRSDSTNSISEADGTYASSNDYSDSLSEADAKYATSEEAVQMDIGENFQINEYFQEEIFDEEISNTNIDINSEGFMNIYVSDNDSYATILNNKLDNQNNKDIIDTENKTGSFNITTTNFDILNYIKILSSKRNNKCKEENKMFLIKKVDASEHESNSKKSVVLCRNLEFTFFITKDDKEFCKSPLISEMITRNKSNSAKRRDTYFMALICIIRLKYEEHNPYCTINIRSKNENIKTNSITIYGYCIHRTCRVYKFKLVEENQGDHAYKVDTYVDKIGVLTHEKDPIVGQTKGLERLLTMKDLEHITAQTLRMQMNNKMSQTLANAGKLETKNKNVLKKIKSQQRNILNRNDDEFTNLIEMAKQNNYMKHVSRLPFAVMCHTLEVFSLLRKKKNEFSKTWHLDGTGSMIKFREASKRIQVYELIARNFAKKENIPIAMLATESHRILDFNNWLNCVRADFESTGYPIRNCVKQVVTDWSWPLIYGIIRAFNDDQHTVAQYLCACYEVCTVFIMFLYY